MRFHLALMVAALALVAAACGENSEDAGTPAPRPTLLSTLTAGEAGHQLEVPGQPPLLLSNRTVELGDIVFDTFNGGSVTLDQATASTIARLSDAIPPIDQPVYGDAGTGDWLDPSDLVLGFVASDGSAYAYPHKILNFHEIVNDELGGEPVVVTYCPLCRSGVVYSRVLDGETLTFGNTSALYRSDMVMFDRETYSYWWQVPGEAIVGTAAGARLQPLASETMEWQIWRDLHPETLLLSRDTGFVRGYERDPFIRMGAAVDSGIRPFQSDPEETDGRLRPSDVVLGIEIDGRNAVYSLTAIGNGVRNGEFGGRPIAIFSLIAGPSGAAFFADPDGYEGERLTFEITNEGWRDLETSSTWDLGGRAIDGALAGAVLEGVPTRTTFWYAFVAAFPEAELRE